MPIIPMQLEHLPIVAHLHATSLAGDFLPSLGEPFLRVFYRTVLRKGLAFGFVELENGLPQGFVLGSADTSTLFRQVILSAGLSLGRAALPSIMHHPGLLRKVAETFLYPDREAVVPEQAELLVIAVDESCRGKGIGEALVNALNTTFYRQRVTSYKVTVLQANAGANRFYQRLGFQLTGQFTLYQKGWNLYLCQLGAISS